MLKPPRPPTPAADFLPLHAQGRSGHPALVDAGSGRAIGYGELDALVGRVAGWLATEHQISISDRVAVCGRNSVEQVVLQLACARLGAILVPINWRLSPAERDLVLADCTPRIFVGASAPPRAGVGFVAAGTVEGLSEAHAPVRRHVPAAFPSLMLYTSGTSGRPKGVPLSEANLFATAVHFTILGRVTPDSVFLVDSPLFHVIGMVTNIRPALMCGGTVIVSAGFDAAQTFARLANPALRVSHYFCVPQMAEMIRGAPDFSPARLAGLTAIFTGGAPNPAPNIRRWLDEGIAMADGYGMTETGTVLGMPPDSETIAAHAGAAGLLPPTIEARIVREDGTECETGETGELLLRGPNVFTGYWRRPEETAMAFTEDGFFRTGDLVRRDAAGFHTIVGRKKEMFISGGENVYPGEVEAVLAAHPAIAEAAVFSVPDAQWGEVGHAAVILRPGADADEAEILAHCGERLARYKLPRGILIVGELPRTGTGKVAKADLARLVTPSTSEDPMGSASLEARRG